MFFLREKLENYLKTNFRKKKDCIFMDKKIFFWHKMIYYAVKYMWQKKNFEKSIQGSK